MTNLLNFIKLLIRNPFYISIRIFDRKLRITNEIVNLRIAAFPIGELLLKLFAITILAPFQKHIWLVACRIGTNLWLVTVGWSPSHSCPVELTCCSFKVFFMFLILLFD